MKTIKILSAIILASNMFAYSQSAGPNCPTVFSVSGNGISWSNLSGISAVDNNPAYADLAQYPTCNSAMCYYSNIASFKKFNFNIPAGAIITGIQLSANQRVSSPGGGIHDSSLVLTVHGIVYGTDHASPSNWTDTPTMNTYGGPTDNWGYSWTPSDINDTSFGLLYQVTNTNYDQPASLDYLSMTVYYQSGSGIVSTNPANWEIGISNNTLFINGVLTSSKEFCQVEVSDMSGKIVYQNETQQGKGAISIRENVSTWSKGTYIVKIVTATGMATKKLLLSR